MAHSRRRSPTRSLPATTEATVRAISAEVRRSSHRLIQPDRHRRLGWAGRWGDGNIVLTNLTDLGLAPLGDYGGPTQTIALLPGSPASARAPPSTGVTADQRGEPLDSPNPDIGAFQSQGFTLTPAAGSTPQSADIGTAFADPLAVTVAANNPVEPVAGGVLTSRRPPAAPRRPLRRDRDHRLRRRRLGYRHGQCLCRLVHRHGFARRRHGRLRPE